MGYFTSVFLECGLDLWGSYGYDIAVFGVAKGRDFQSLSSLKTSVYEDFSITSFDVDFNEGVGFTFVTLAFVGYGSGSES